MKAKHFLAVAAVALVLAACSSSSGSGTSTPDSAYGEALARNLASQPDSPFSQADSDCLGGEFAAVVGDDRFEAAGIEPEDLEGSESPTDLGLQLTEDDVEAFAAVFETCDIQVSDLFLEAMGAEDELPKEFVDCMEREVDEAELRELMARTLVMGEAGDDDAIFDLIGACLQFAM